MAMQWARGLLGLAALHVAVAQKLPKDSPGNIMLMCDACVTVIKDMNDDVKYLVESEKAWAPEDLRERIRASCGSPNVPNGQGKDACGYFVTDYQETIAQEVTRRWQEDDELFEEGFAPREFCEQIGVCADQGFQSINKMLSESETKHKHLEEEKKEKEKSKGKKKKRVQFDDDDDEEEEED